MTDTHLTSRIDGDADQDQASRARCGAVLCYPRMGVYLKGARELGIVSPFSCFWSVRGPLFEKTFGPNSTARHYGPTVAVPAKSRGASVL